MARQFKLTISEVGTDKTLHETNVESASWTTALDKALSQLGEVAIPSTASRTIAPSGVVTIVDIHGKRKYLLTPIMEAKPGKNKKSGSKPGAASPSSPGTVDAPVEPRTEEIALASDPTTVSNQSMEAAQPASVAVEHAPSIPAPTRPPSIGRLSSPAARRSEGPRKAKQTVAYIPSITAAHANISPHATSKTLVDATPIVAAATEELQLDDATLAAHAAVPPAAPQAATSSSSVAATPAGTVAPAAWLVLVHQRDEEPTANSPLCYRERTFFLASTRDADEVETEVRRQFDELRGALQSMPRGQLIKMAVFDHRFATLPERAPLLTLEWRDWRPAVAVSRHDPTRPFRKKPVERASSIPPAPVEQSVVLQAAAPVADAAPTNRPSKPSIPMTRSEEARAMEPKATASGEGARIEEKKASLPAPSKISPRRATVAFAMQPIAKKPSSSETAAVAMHEAPIPAQAEPVPTPAVIAAPATPTSAVSPVVSAAVSTVAAGAPAISTLSATKAVEVENKTPRDSVPGEPVKSPWTSRSMVGSERLGQAFEAASDLFFLQTPIAGAEYLVKTLHSLTRAEKIAVLLYDIDGDELRPVVLSPKNDALRGVGVPAKDGLTRSAIRSGAVTTRDDATADPGFSAATDALLFSAAETHAMMIGPSMHGGRLHAVVQAACKVPFDGDDQQVFAYLVGRFGEFIHQSRLQLPRKSRLPPS